MSCRTQGVILRRPSVLPSVPLHGHWSLNSPVSGLILVPWAIKLALSDLNLTLESSNQPSRPQISPSGLKSTLQASKLVPQTSNLPSKAESCHPKFKSASGRLEIHPCVLQEIRPMGVLPCSHSTTLLDHSKLGIGYRWPCVIIRQLVILTQIHFHKILTSWGLNSILEESKLAWRDCLTTNTLYITSHPRIAHGPRYPMPCLDWLAKK